MSSRRRQSPVKRRKLGDLDVRRAALGPLFLVVFDRFDVREVEVIFRHLADRVDAVRLAADADDHGPIHRLAETVRAVADFVQSPTMAMTARQVDAILKLAGDLAPLASGLGSKLPAEFLAWLVARLDQATAQLAVALKAALREAMGSDV